MNYRENDGSSKYYVVHDVKLVDDSSKNDRRIPIMEKFKDY